jgi:hypothetical protein
MHREESVLISQLVEVKCPMQTVAELPPGRNQSSTPAESRRAEAGCLTTMLIFRAMMLGGRLHHYAEIRSSSHKRAGCELANRPACKHFWKIKQHGTECSDTTTSDTRKRCWIGRNCCHGLGWRRQQNGIFGPYWVLSIL